MPYQHCWYKHGVKVFVSAWIFNVDRANNSVITFQFRYLLRPIYAREDPVHRMISIPNGNVTVDLLCYFSELLLTSCWFCFWGQCVHNQPTKYPRYLSKSNLFGILGPLRLHDVATIRISTNEDIFIIRNTKFFHREKSDYVTQTI